MNKKRLIVSIVIIVVSLLVWTGFLTQKGRYHEDEVYSVSSSVDAIWEKFLVMDEEGVPIVRNREEYKDFISSHGFNPVLIYMNQWRDVHPPLYYIVLHCIAVVLPCLTLEVGFILNMIFFVLMDVVLIRLFLLVKRERAIIPGLILFNLSAIGVNMIVYQRMYVMVAFFVLMTCYLTVKLIQNGFRMDAKEAAKLGATVLGGFLTQYFYLIYVLPLFVIVLVMMLRKGVKPWRYILTHAAAGVVGILCFPVCFQHVLFSYRGAGAMAETSAGRMPELAQIFIGGGFIYVILEILLIFGVMRLMKREAWKWVMVVPAALYLVIVAMIAPWVDLRYFMPVLVFPVIWAALVLGEVKCEVAAVAVATAAGAASLFLPVKYLFADYRPALDFAKAHSEQRMVYVTHFSFNALQNIKENLIYRESAAVEYGNRGKISEIVDDEFVLRVDNWLHPEEIVEELEREGWTVIEDAGTWPYPAYLMRR